MKEAILFGTLKYIDAKIIFTKKCPVNRTPFYSCDYRRIIYNFRVFGRQPQPLHPDLLQKRPDVV